MLIQIPPEFPTAYVTVLEITQAGRIPALAPPMQSFSPRYSYWSVERSAGKLERTCTLTSDDFRIVLSRNMTGAFTASLKITALQFWNDRNQKFLLKKIQFPDQTYEVQQPVYRRMMSALPPGFTGVVIDDPIIVKLEMVRSSSRSSWQKADTIIPSLNMGKPVVLLYRNSFNVVKKAVGLSGFSDAYAACASYLRS